MLARSSKSNLRGRTPSAPHFTLTCRLPSNKLWLCLLTRRPSIQSTSRVASAPCFPRQVKSSQVALSTIQLSKRHGVAALDAAPPQRSPTDAEGLDVNHREHATTTSCAAAASRRAASVALQPATRCRLVATQQRDMRHGRAATGRARGCFAGQLQWRRRPSQGFESQIRATAPTIPSSAATAIATGKRASTDATDAR